MANLIYFLTKFNYNGVVASPLNVKLLIQAPPLLLAVKDRLLKMGEFPYNVVGVREII